jgi:hypothetical protein
LVYREKDMFISAVPLQGIASWQNVNFRVGIPVKHNVPTQPADAFVRQQKAIVPSQVAPPHFGKIINITVLDGNRGDGDERTRKKALENLGGTLGAKSSIIGPIEDLNKSIGVFFNQAPDNLEAVVESILNDDGKSFEEQLEEIQRLK